MWHMWLLWLSLLEDLPFCNQIWRLRHCLGIRVLSFRSLGRMRCFCCLRCSRRLRRLRYFRRLRRLGCFHRLRCLRCFRHLRCLSWSVQPLLLRLQAALRPGLALTRALLLFKLATFLRNRLLLETGALQRLPSWSQGHG